MKKVKFARLVAFGLFMLFLTPNIIGQPPNPPQEHGSGNDQNPGGGANLGSGLILLIGLGSVYAGTKVFDFRKPDEN